MFYMLEEWIPTTHGIYHVLDKPKQALWGFLQIESRPIGMAEKDVLNNTRHFQDNKEKCTICQENLDSQDNGVLITTLECDHQFHLQCLAQ